MSTKIDPNAKYYKPPKHLASHAGYVENVDGYMDYRMGNEALKRYVREHREQFFIPAGASYVDANVSKNSGKRFLLFTGEGRHSLRQVPIGQIFRRSIGIVQIQGGGGMGGTGANLDTTTLPLDQLFSRRIRLPPVPIDTPSQPNLNNPPNPPQPPSSPPPPPPQTTVIIPSSPSFVGHSDYADTANAQNQHVVTAERIVFYDSVRKIVKLMNETGLNAETANLLGFTPFSMVTLLEDWLTENQEAGSI